MSHLASRLPDFGSPALSMIQGRPPVPQSSFSRGFSVIPDPRTHIPCVVGTSLANWSYGKTHLWTDV
jgi:hypothetical protein